MCRGDDTASHAERLASGAGQKNDVPSFLRLYFFCIVLLVDAIFSLIIFTPLVPGVEREEFVNYKHYSLSGCVWDLTLLGALRVVLALVGLVRAHHRAELPRAPFEEYHRNGEKKSREELEQEALEEACLPWFGRYVGRYSFPCEVVAVVTGLVVMIKCLARLNVEIGLYEDARPMHPLFWVALTVTALLSLVEASSMDSMVKLAILHAQRRIELRGGDSRRTICSSRTDTWLGRVSSSLSIPLLGGGENGESEEIDLEQNDGREDENNSNANSQESNGKGNDRAVSDIKGDPQYKAGWTDLLGVCYPDIHLILLAFLFLVAAAIAQVYIPRFTGNILDELVKTSAEDDDDSSIWKMPGFMINVELLVVASILGGIFSGLRGAIFTQVGGRVNVRLRILLMDSLLSQDIGFFDTTKTGDITSRLSSDTTLVGDQVTLNVNVFLRSFVQAVGVLIFMFLISWQLSLLAFISVPAITVLSKWYGQFVRSLTKLMQKKLADGNSVSEAAIGSMPTVRAFGAEGNELKEFETCMKSYLSMNLRASIAYFGYATCVTALPQLVIALVLFYGGLLVRSQGSDHITSGQLVSFLLYLSSLSDAFNSIGSIFASLTAAVGAADKVFELIHRSPKIAPPALNATSVPTDNDSSIDSHEAFGIVARRTTEHHKRGLHPDSCVGEVCLTNVNMFYPARPTRQILNGLTLKAPPGAVIALVGKSGGGKSSIISLVQHLYEPSSGVVSIDGHKVSDLSPEWLSRKVSVVSQEPTLFARSIRSNIIYGLEGTANEPSFEEVEEAARLANASSFIEGLPDGYETDVGERGVQLSGGQKQRIAIARALVRKPRVLLLDEATSALDAESEASVQEAIDTMLARGRESKDTGSSFSMTVIVVAHRLSTVRNSDIIFVIDNGEVIEAGSHTDLLQNVNGPYSNLISRQMKAQDKLENKP